MKFLGEIRNPDINLLLNLITIAFSGDKLLYLSTTKLGIFPNHKKPHTLWMGIGGLNLSELIHRQDYLENLIADNGFQMDTHKYIPHLTIGRIQKNIHKSALNKLLKYVEMNDFDMNIHFEIKEICLMKSNMDAKGVSYETLAAYQLSI